MQGNISQSDSALCPISLISHCRSPFRPQKPWRGNNRRRQQFYPPPPPSPFRTLVNPFLRCFRIFCFACNALSSSSSSFSSTTIIARAVDDFLRAIPPVTGTVLSPFKNIFRPFQRPYATSICAPTNVRHYRKLPPSRPSRFSNSPSSGIFAPFPLLIPDFPTLTLITPMPAPCIICDRAQRTRSSAPGYEYKTVFSFSPAPPAAPFLAYDGAARRFYNLSTFL